MRIGALIAIVLSLLFLAGCSSYRPLYGKGPNGEGVTTALAAVTVPEQHSRSTQLVRNELLTTMGSAVSRFSLKILATEKTIDVSTLSASGLHRKRYNLVVHYELVGASASGVLASGDSFSNVSFDTIRQPVADLQAADNAMARAAQEVGQDIRQRIAAYFSNHQT